MTNCTEACSGSCTAQATVDCQLSCQTEVIQECETEMVETCETECEDKGGAIFCDGQFVNASDVEACASELSAEIEIDIDIQASVDIDINGGDGDDECDAEADDCEDGDNESVGEEIDKACTVSNVRPTTLGGSAGAFAAIAALAFMRTRRRNGR